MTNKTSSALIWAVADLLRGNFKQSEYGLVILPFTILRRLDCVLEPTKTQVLKEYEGKKPMPLAALERFLAKAASFQFFNISAFTFSSLLGDSANLRANLTTYVGLFSDNVRDIFERFNFQDGNTLSEDGLLAKGAFEQNEFSKIFDNADFGYSTLTVERPLRDEQGNIVLGSKGKQKGQPQPDSSLRDTENVRLKEDIQAYFEREVLPHAPDAWIDHDKTRVGYEISFNRHFYKYIPPRPLDAIDADLKALSAEIMDLLKEVTA